MSRSCIGKLVNDVRSEESGLKTSSYGSISVDLLHSRTRKQMTQPSRHDNVLPTRTMLHDCAHVICLSFEFLSEPECPCTRKVWPPPHILAVQMSLIRIAKAACCMAACLISCVGKASCSLGRPLGYLIFSLMA